MVTLIKDFDLVFIEFNIGNIFLNVLPRALENKGPVGETKVESHLSMHCLILVIHDIILFFLNHNMYIEFFVV